jgi:hypothetical protein
LKDSAGTKGYDHFTELTLGLQKAANAADRERTGLLIAELQHAADRVVAPGEETAVA